MKKAFFALTIAFAVWFSACSSTTLEKYFELEMGVTSEE